MSARRRFDPFAMRPDEVGLFKERIRESYDRLTPGFRKLADFIMNNTLDVAFFTATELARYVGVDAATVVRFSQEIGYSGYRELSREIKRFVRNRLVTARGEATRAETTAGKLQAIANYTADTMRQFSATELATVAKTVELLSQARHIWLAGEFSEYYIAEFLAKRLQLMGIGATAFMPSMASSSTVLTQMKDDDVLVAIIGLGPGVEVGHAIQLANAAGVDTIAVTTSGVALGARHADVTLLVPDDSPAGVSSFGPMMQVLSLIWEGMMMQQPETVEERNRVLPELMRQLVELRAATSEHEVGAPQNIWRENIGQNDDRDSAEE